MSGIERMTSWSANLPWRQESTAAVQSRQDQQVIHAATRAFSELGVALAINFAIMTCVAAPLGMAFISLTLVGLAGELAYELASYTAKRLEWLPSDSKNKGLRQQALDHCHFFSSLSLMNCIGLAGPTIAVHEAGHALAGLACYRGASPHISIMPFEGGLTSIMDTSRPTNFGKLLGVNGSLALVAAGGVIATTVVAMAALAGAKGLRKSYPTLSRALELLSYVQLLGDVLHGITSMRVGSDDSNDFACIYAHAGVPPWVVVALMILLPMTQKLLMDATSSSAGSKP